MALSDIAAEALASTFHTDSISIFPPLGRARGTVNNDLTVSYSVPVARASGLAAHVEPLVSRPTSDDGGATIVAEEYAVKVGGDLAADTRPGDRIRIDSASDPALVGVDLTVIRVEGRTAGLSRRVICRRPRTTQKPG